MSVTIRYDKEDLLVAEAHLAPLHRPTAINARPVVISTRCALEEWPIIQSADVVASEAVKRARGRMRYPEAPEEPRACISRL
jgi:hypothetical protein